MLDSYHVAILTGALLALYAVSSWLVRRGVLTLCAQRRVWNTVLLGAFAASAALGLALAALIDADVRIPWYRVVLWLHVEFGIALTVVGACHALWHARYYLQPVRRAPARPNECAAP